MALSGSQIVRVGAGGQPRPKMGSFAGKTEQVAVGPPKFEGLRKNIGRFLR